MSPDNDFQALSFDEGYIYSVCKECSMVFPHMVFNNENSTWKWLDFSVTYYNNPIEPRECSLGCRTSESPPEHCDTSLNHCVVTIVIDEAQAELYCIKKAREHSSGYYSYGYAESGYKMDAWGDGRQYLYYENRDSITDPPTYEQAGLDVTDNDQLIYQLIIPSSNISATSEINKNNLQDTNACFKVVMHSCEDDDKNDWSAFRRVFYMKKFVSNKNIPFKKLMEDLPPVFQLSDLANLEKEIGVNEDYEYYRTYALDDPTCQTPLKITDIWTDRVNRILPPTKCKLATLHRTCMVGNDDSRRRVSLDLDNHEYDWTKEFKMNMLEYRPPTSLKWDCSIDYEELVWMHGRLIE